MANVAMLIDAENVSADIVDSAFQKLSPAYQITLKRAYGDFSKNHLQNGRKLLSSITSKPFIVLAAIKTVVILC